MIRGTIFDLDGVLVKTEELKAISYARAIANLCPDTVTEREAKEAFHDVLEKADQRVREMCLCSISESEVIEAYREMVGRSRHEMANALIEHFDLDSALRLRMSQYEVTEPWEALIKVRMPIYEAMVSNAALLRDSVWPHTVSLLHSLRREGYKTALSTMSDRKQVVRILEVIGLSSSFDVVVTGGEVKKGKPDPEIYQLISQIMRIPPSQCLVFEDSPSGIRAGLAAGMWVIAIVTPFTRHAVHTAHILDNRWIVDDPAILRTVVDQMLNEREADTS